MKKGQGTVQRFDKLLQTMATQPEPSETPQAGDHQQDGQTVPAREPGGGKLTPIEDAPGSYVKVRD